MLHSGYLLKLGEGPINYDWNNRFIVLDSKPCYHQFRIGSSHITKTIATLNLAARYP